MVGKELHQHVKLVVVGPSRKPNTVDQESCQTDDDDLSLKANRLAGRKKISPLKNKRS